MALVGTAVAAGIILHQHKKAKDRREAMRAEAEEDLRRRGWIEQRADGSQPSTPGTPGTPSGLMPPTPQHPPRPNSAPPPSYGSWPQDAGFGKPGQEKDGRQAWQQQMPPYSPPGPGGYQSPPGQHPYGYPQQYPPTSQPQPQPPYSSFGPPSQLYPDQRMQYTSHSPHASTFPPPNTSTPNQNLSYKRDERVSDEKRRKDDRRRRDKPPYDVRTTPTPASRYHEDRKRRSLTPPPMYRV